MKKENDILKSLKNKGSGFTLPEDYLANFEVRLEHKTEESKTGFSLPKDYFETVEDKILAKVSQPTSTGFKTPDNYFETVDNKILDNLQLNKKSKVISLVQRPLFKVIGYAVAASLVLFFGIKSIYFSNTVPSDFDSVTVAQIDTWIDEDLVSFSNYDIADNFADADFSIETNISDEELLDYLDQTDIENLILKE